MGTRVGVFLRSRIWSTQVHPAGPPSKSAFCPGPSRIV